MYGGGLLPPFCRSGIAGCRRRQPLRVSVFLRLLPWERLPHGRVVRGRMKDIHYLAVCFYKTPRGGYTSSGVSRQLLLEEKPFLRIAVSLIADIGGSKPPPYGFVRVAHCRTGVYSRRFIGRGYRRQQSFCIWQNAVYSQGEFRSRPPYGFVRVFRLPHKGKAGKHKKKETDKGESVSFL